MSKLTTILFFLFSCNTLFAQHLKQTALQRGDLIFQNLDCGPMCDAIEAVTEGVDGQDFSHVAMVCKKGDSLMVIEAMGAGVRMVSLDFFEKRTKNRMYVGRLKKQYRNLIKDAIAFSEKQIGVPYDDEFIYDNGKYYCSELIYDAFKVANRNVPIFTLEPMTYKQPGSDSFFPVWVEYYKQLNAEIPEGKPGCNPGGLSRSPKINIIGTISNPSDN